MPPGINLLCLLGRRLEELGYVEGIREVQSEKRMVFMLENKGFRCQHCHLDKL